MLKFEPYYPLLSSQEILNTIKQENIFNIVIKENINLIDNHIEKIIMLVATLKSIIINYTL